KFVDNFKKEGVIGIVLLGGIARGYFALNKRLIPANPWILWCSKFLGWLPDNFVEKIKEALLVKAFTKEDLERRINAIKYLLA
ncbi:MAG: hypothetical protein ACTSU6_03780, partial [Candidatus Njordarchaeales archaeon]